MDEGTLASIKADRLREMISTWLKQISPPPAWNVLADAVEVIDPNKAEEIKILTMDYNYSSYFYVIAKFCVPFACGSSI